MKNKSAEYPSPPSGAGHEVKFTAKAKSLIDAFRKHPHFYKLSFLTHRKQMKGKSLQRNLFPWRLLAPQMWSGVVLDVNTGR